MMKLSGLPRHIATVLVHLLIVFANLDVSPVLAQIQFEEVTTAAGMTHEGPSFGASWGDFNGDGWADLWVSNHATPPSLYINNGDWTFTDIVPDMSQVDFSGDTHGAAWADFDNDGDQDLLLLSGAGSGVGTGPNKFLVNTSGTFQERAVDYGLDYPLGRGRTPLWLDWNKDGYLDVFLANSERPDGQAPSALLTQGYNSFHFDNELTGITFETNHWAQIADLPGTGNWALIVHGYSYPNRIYSYDSIPFTDIRDTIGLSSNWNVRDTVIEDLNGDVLPDFFLTRRKDCSRYVQTGISTIKGSITVNQDEKGLRFRTSGDVSFQLDPKWSFLPSDVFIGSEGTNPESRTFSLSPADPAVAGLLNHEPGVDCCVFVGYDPDEESWEISVSKKSWMRVNMIIDSTGVISDVTTIDFVSSDGALADRLLIQREEGFQDWTATAGLDTPSASNSVVAGDFDNDMDIDLYVVCGGNVVINPPNLLYENLGGAVFKSVPDAGGASGTNEGQGDSAVVADYDRDGFLDLFVSNGGDTPPFNSGPHQLFRNIGNSNHWIEIEIEGVVSNRDGIGTRLLVTAGGVTQLRQEAGGTHRFSQNQQRVHFGLGSNTMIDSLVIHWPSGIVQELENVPADQIIHVVEDVCECDLNGDGSCNILDWPYFIEDWGRTDCNDPGVDCECDLNGDGGCNILDWPYFIEDFGRTDCL